MKISDFIRVIVNDYITPDTKIIPEAARRIKYLMDTNGYVERFNTLYDDLYQIWLHVDVQIGAQDYPDRL